jgi:hypothetical protein
MYLSTRLVNQYQENDNTISEKYIGKDKKGIGPGLILGIFRHLPGGTEDDHEKPVGITGLRFDFDTDFVLHFEHCYKQPSQFVPERKKLRRELIRCNVIFHIRIKT